VYESHRIAHRHPKQYNTVAMVSGNDINVLDIFDAARYFDSEPIIQSDLHRSGRCACFRPLRQRLKDLNGLNAQRSAPTVCAARACVFYAFLAISQYYQPSICNDDGAVTLFTVLRGVLLILSRPSHSVRYGLDFAYTPLAAHLRDTNKSRFKAKAITKTAVLLGREISRG
jgi:hypothetical protein